MKKNHILSSFSQIFFIVFLGCFLLCFGTCKKKESRYYYNNGKIPQVNDYSSVFCKINDSNWCDCMPLGQGFETSGVYADYFVTYQNTPLEIRARDYCDSNYRSFFFYIDEFNGIGKYKLSSTTSYVHYSLFSRKWNDNIVFPTYPHNIGLIEITKFDSKKKMFSGVFSFQVSDSTQTIEIAEGIFENVKYN